MNAAEWRRLARPVTEDLRACLVEHGSVEFSPAALGGLYHELTRAAHRRDLAAYRAACAEVKREAARRGALYARAEGRMLL